MDEFEFIFFLSDSEFKIFFVGVVNELLIIEEIYVDKQSKKI